MRNCKNFFVLVVDNTMLLCVWGGGGCCVCVCVWGGGGGNYIFKK